MIGRRDFLKLISSLFGVPFAERSKIVLPTETELIAQSLADLAKRVKALESLQRMDLGTSRFLRDAPLAIASGVPTPIPLTSATLGSGFDWDISDPTKIYCPPARDQTWFVIIGQVCEWESPVPPIASLRKLYFLTSTAGGAPLSILTPYNLDAPTSTADLHYYPFTGGLLVRDPTDYLQAYVQQNTGIPVNFTYLSFFTFIIK